MSKRKSPAHGDHHGVKVLKTRAHGTATEGVTMFVKIARPYSVRAREGKRLVTAWPFVCALSREQYDALPDVIESTPPTRASEQKRRSDAQLVDSLCWCESQIVRVRAYLVSLGRTESCSDPDCYNRYRAVRGDEGSSK